MADNNNLARPSFGGAELRPTDARKLRRSRARAIATRSLLSLLVVLWAAAVTAQSVSETGSRGLLFAVALAPIWIAVPHAAARATRTRIGESPAVNGHQLMLLDDGLAVALQAADVRYVRPTLGNPFSPLGALRPWNAAVEVVVSSPRVLPRRYIVIGSDTSSLIRTLEEAGFVVWGARVRRLFRSARDASER